MKQRTPFAGSPVAKLRPMFATLVERVAEYLREPARVRFDLADIDHYVRAISMLSLGELLGATDTQRACVLAFAGKRGQDALIDHLAGRARGKRLAHPRPFARLERALGAKDAGAAADELIAFLQTYYAGIRKTYFHNTHLKDDAGFVGYWSFEAALVAVRSHVDDSGFADNPYYPADLAAYARKKAKRGG